MKNKVVNAVLGISAVASVGVSGFLYSENVNLNNELADVQSALTQEQETQAENEKILSEYALLIDECNENAKHAQASLDELHEKMNHMEIIEGYVIEPVDNQTMYVQEDTNLRIGPSTDYKVAEEIKKNTEVTVIGKVTNAEGKTWYVISSADEDKIETGVNDTNILEPNEDGTERMHHMISASLLADTKPAPVKPKTQSNSNSGNSGSAAAPSQPAAPNTPTCDCDCDCDTSCNDVGCDIASCNDSAGITNNIITEW